jgi:hypothetical protein
MSNIGGDHKPPVTHEQAMIAFKGHSDGNALIVEWEATEASIILMNRLHPDGLPPRKVTLEK